MSKNNYTKKIRSMHMTNFYKHLAFGLIAATSPLAMQAQVLVPDTIYKQTFDPRGSINTMDIVDADNGKSTWEEDAEYGNLHAVNVVLRGKNDLGLNIDADDWLVTPDVELKANRLYTVAYKAFSPGAKYDDEWIDNGNVNQLDVLIGQGKDYSTYTSIIDDPKLKQIAHFYEYKAFVRNRKDGKYRIAFNDKSKVGCFPTRLDDIFVIEGPLLQAPDSVQAFTATPGDKGAHTVAIKCNAPAQDLDNTPLASLQKVSLLRDGKLIHTFDAPLPGAALSYTDDDAQLKSGYHTYELYATGASGDGLAISRTSYVGIDIPEAPTKGKVTDMGDKIRLSWNAPQGGKRGFYVDPDNITYNIYVNLGREKKLVARGVKGTSYDIDNTFEGEQDETDFRVTAVTDAGEGAQLIMPEVILGTPYELPFAESFVGGRTEKFWWRTSDGYENLSEFKFVQYNIGESGALKGADDDYAFAMFQPLDDDETVELNTGKLSLRDAKQPTLKFAYAFWSSAYDSKLDVLVQAAGKEDQVVGTYEPAPNLGMGVTFVNTTIDLSQFVGEKYVFVKFRATSCPENPVYVDNVVINDGDYDIDLATTITAVGNMTGGESEDVQVKVSNFGKERVKGYTVQLLEDGKVVDSLVEPIYLKSMKSRTETFTYKAPVGKDKVTLTAKVIAAGDENALNDLSSPLEIKLSQPTLSRPTALKLQGSTLSWTAPDVQNADRVEGFEDYTPFDIKSDNIGPWGLIDGDQSWTQGVPLSDNLQDVAKYPGDVQEDAFAWMVFAPTLTTPNLEEYYSDGQFTPHGGKQYAIAACAVDIATTASSNDDWLISPLLTGEAQTITLWAMSPSQMQEHFDILVSSHSDDSDDFSILKSDITGTVNDSWQQYSYDLPEGTKYFAVRYSSSDEFMMGLDDIAYSVGDGTLKGYNIYCDGTLAGTADAATTTFSVGDADGHTYTVTAVYTRGESAPSDAVGTGTGIAGTQADSNDAPTQWYDTAGRATGKTAQRGVFIVRKADGNTVKVMRR